MIILNLLFSAVYCHAQKYLIHTYTEDEGLPSSNVNSISQDSSGFIWVATRSGLCTYDSHKWKTYLSNNGIPFDNAIKVKVDEKGQVWLLQQLTNIDNNLEGLNLLKYENNRWKSFPIKMPYGAFINDNAMSFSLSTNSNNKTIAAFSIYNHGVYLFIDNKWSFYNAHNTSLSSNKIISTYIYNNDIYITADSSVYKYVPNSNKPFQKVFNNISYLKNKIVLNLCIENVNNSEKIWFYTNQGIGYYYQNKFNVVVDNLNLHIDSRMMPYSIIPNYFNSLVFSNSLEIKIYNKNTKELESFSRLNGLIDNGANEMFIDREKILWISSARGISKVSSIRFQNYYQINGMLDDEVASIIEQTPGKFVLGHNFGISFFDGKTFKKQSFNKDQYFERVNVMAKDKDNNIWFACFKNGLGKIDKSGKTIFYSAAKLGISGGVLSVAVDSIGRVLFTSNNQLFQFVNGKSKEIPIEGVKNKPTYLRNIFVLKNNRIVLTTKREGIYIIEDNKVTNLLLKSNVNACNVYSVLENENGSLFIGTEDGLYRYEKGRYERAYLNNYSIEKRVFFLTFNKKSHTLWIGTDAGVISFNEKELWSYGVKEGLAGLETNRGAAIINSEGNLMIGTNRGLSIYRDEYDINRSVLPITQLLNYEISGKTYSPESDVQVSSNNNNIIFNFNIVSFYDENRNSIKYRLEGRDGDWIETSNLDDYFIKYTNLEPGTYRFIFKAKNALGKWSNEICSGTIKIEGPFYKSIWTLLLGLPILILLIGFYIKISTNRRYRLRLESEVKERTYQLETSEKRYKQMFEDNNAIMLLINPENGKIEDANPSALKFYAIAKDEMLNKSIFDFARDSEVSPTDVLNSLTNDNEFEISQYLEATDSLRHLKIHLSRIDNEDKTTVFCIIDDVTVQKNASDQLVKFNEELEERVLIRTIDLEEALKTLNEEIENRTQAENELIAAKKELEKSLNREKELSRLKSRFISMVSHEYRTPLTVIFSSAELIKEFAKISKPEACSDYAKRIQDSVKTLTALLEGVMAIGEDTVINVFKETFNINNFFKYVADTFSANIKNSHELVVNYLETDITVFQDKNLLWGTINQVLSNAAKFSDKGSKIQINYIADDKYLKISISDEGKGIPSEELDLIFEPFYKAADNIGIVSGTGLGLAIAKKNIDVLSGKIYAKSELGNGSTFYIEVPIN